MGFANNKMEQTKEKQFTEMISLMTSVNQWSLRNWRDSIDKQLNSWMMYIPGLSSSGDVEKVKQFKGLFSSIKFYKAADEFFL